MLLQQGPAGKGKGRQVKRVMLPWQRSAGVAFFRTKLVVQLEVSEALQCSHAVSTLNG
jgi:hypothetical protein